MTNSAARVERITALLQMSGDIDFASADNVADRARMVLHTPGVTDLVLDLANVRFIDSRGISTLVQVRREAVELGVRLRVEGANKRTRRVLDLCGLTRWLDVQ